MRKSNPSKGWTTFLKQATSVINTEIARGFHVSPYEAFFARPSEWHPATLADDEDQQLLSELEYEAKYGYSIIDAGSSEGTDMRNNTYVL